MRVASLSVLLVAAWILFDPSPGASSRGLQATLDGQPIALRDAGRYACHDYELPKIRCFSSVARLEAATGQTLETQVTAAGKYVVAYEHALYAGSNPKVLTTDVPWLSDIGWNDKISSFKSFGATGNWRENSPAGGFFYYFGATSQVPSLSNTYNDKFSALYID